MNWILGKYYEVFGERRRLTRVYRAGPGAPLAGEFTGDRSTVMCDLSILGEPKPLAPRLTLGRAFGVSDTAEARALTEFDTRRVLAAALMHYRQDWQCVSNKRLRVARGPARYFRNDADWLRRRRGHPDVQSRTVDVDTYVALKWLRRGVHPITRKPWKDSGAPFQEELKRLMAFDKPPRSTYGEPCKPHFDPCNKLPSTYESLKKLYSEGPSYDPVKARYIESLKALPDSLYKRVQLRLAQLPKDVRRDHEACKKAFDREVAKEKQK